MKKSKKIFLITFLIIFIAVFIGMVFVKAVFFVPQSEITVPSSINPLPTPASAVQSPVSQVLINKNPPAPTYPDSYPKRLSIPVISVDAKIQYVGTTKNGNMATPTNFTDVGWYQNGTVPGSLGSAVIDGHVDNGLAFPAVFADLGNLNIGDDIFIYTVGKSTLHFKVISLKNYDAKADATEIFSQGDNNYLKLITCAGVWSILHRTHDQRLVVTAEIAP